jgi:hypothetical protein
MDTDEASIPTEPERTTNEPNKSISGTTLKRKVCTETCVTKLSAANIKSSPDEDIPARKKPRLQVSLPAIAADADTLNASPDAAVAVASADAGGRDPVAASPMQPNEWAIPESHRLWTLEEDTNLTTAVKTTCKKKYGEEYRPDWVAIAELVPGRTKNQCGYRWRNVLESKSDETIVRVGKWTTDEDSTLKDAVATHYGEDWVAIAALVPGRTKQQCVGRWHNAFLAKDDETIARVGEKWTKEEDVKLKDAVEKHNYENWAAISALVPGRTKQQCVGRWHNTLLAKDDDTIARVGKWSTDEDSTLKDAVEKHNGKNWAAISALVPGRTKKQCLHRWHSVLDSNSDETITASVGKWTKEEDSTLKDAVEKHNGKNWAAIAALVLGRTKTQCLHRWHDNSRSKIDKATARMGIK